jgi:hypothetical protein
MSDKHYYFVNRSTALAGCKWLKQHGAEWPTVLQHNSTSTQWSDAAVKWARSEGCTAPLAAVVPVAVVPAAAGAVAAGAVAAVAVVLAQATVAAAIPVVELAAEAAS